MSRSLVSAFTPSLYSIDSIWKPSSVSHIRQFQMSHEHKRSRTDLNLIPFSSSNPGSSTNSSEALMAALTDTILPVQLESESESEIESKNGQSTTKSVTNSSVLRSIISSILNSKENSQSENNLPSKVSIEEALCLLDSLQSSAEKEATNAYNFKQKNSSNKQVCDNTLGESVIEKSNSLDVIRNDSIMTLLSQKSLSAVHSLRKMMLNFGPSKSKGRKALMSTLSNIITNQNPSKVLAITCLVSALCLYDSSDERSFSEDDHRSLSRAVVSGLLPNGRYDNEKKKKQKKIEQSKNDDELDIDSQVFANSFGSHAVLALLKVAKGDTHNIKIDLHIVTGISRAFISDYTPEIKKMASDVIREKLYIYNDADMLENDNFVLPSNVISVKKVQVTGALGLAAEIGPFCQMSPITLVYLSVEMNLWHAAERICDSAILNNSLETHEAVHALIDSASTRHLFRQSDTYATYFYDNGGRSRYTEARFKHACDTISKVVLKRHYPIVEKQVERVDKAFERVQNDKSKFEEQDDEQEEEEKENNRNGPQEIREFALKRVIDVGDQETAHRFSSLWNIGFLYNEEEIEKYAQSRREKYIQWDDVFSDSSSSVDAIPVPDLIDDPDEMIICFRVLESTVNKKNPVIGFDVEWGDEGDGAALLQLSTMKKAILIDIPALSTTVEGCNSLECTVGKLFAGQGSTTVAAGFSCKQDLSRLRASPSVTETHWFHGTSAFIDIKPMIGNSIPKLKLLGLSRICKHYLGKPLDKSEQCSLWTNRPLSLSQRAYAALDAWAVVAIYQKLPPIKLS